MVARDQTALVKSAWEVEVMPCSRIYFVQDVLVFWTVLFRVGVVWLR